MTDVSNAQSGELRPMMDIKGYTLQSKAKQDLVNSIKETEERFLRVIDELKKSDDVDNRWLAIGQTYMQQAYMAVIRSIFKPQRISLPGDTK